VRELPFRAYAVALDNRLVLLLPKHACWCCRQRDLPSALLWELLWLCAGEVSGTCKSSWHVYMRTCRDGA
jgi:hypothetical protein